METISDTTSFSYNDDERSRAEADLHEARKINDLRLKSTFEHIFEKYSKDFGDVADEIDLASGEIVIDKGHLAEMKDEHDVGNEASDILRSFATHQDLAGAEDDGEFTEPSSPSSLHGSNQIRTHGNSRPTDDDIMKRFGQEVGPQVAQYIAQLQSKAGPTSKSAWWAPEIPGISSSPLPASKTFVETRTGTPPSSPSQQSLWSLPKPKGPVPGSKRQPRQSNSSSPAHETSAETFAADDVGAARTPAQRLSSPPKPQNAKPVDIIVSSPRVSKCGDAGYRCSKPFCLTCE
ncbi:MAG: hypothetical protein M1825_006107 [Sarcosagium campestre]|nr:MAG: hypothetical protein M1825_006107 [Sarcosagium campestre]